MAKVTREQVRHDLEQDVVIESGREIWTYYREHQTKIIAVIVALLVIYVAAGVVRRSRQSAVDQANLRILEARTMMYRGMAASDEAESRQMFENCQRSLAPVIESFSGSPLGRRAAYLSGVAYFTNTRYGKAREQFEVFGRYAGDNLDRARAAMAIGVTYENEAFVKQDDSLLEQAVEHYRKASDLGAGSYVRYQAMLAEARVLARSPKTRGEAEKLLEDVIRNRQIQIDQATPAAPADETTLAAAAGNPLETLSFVEQARERLEALRAMEAL